MANKTIFDFRPFSKRQRMVLSWWTAGSPVHSANGIICDGAIRSGKTICMSLSFVFWAMEHFDRTNFAICGRTIKSLQRNVIITLKAMLDSRGYDVTEKFSKSVLIVRRNGRENYFYMFGGQDESSAALIQGITLGGVLFDEVALQTRSFVMQAIARCSIAGSTLWFNCNPEYPQHWFYLEYIKKARKLNLLYLHFTMEDNLTLSEEMKQRYRDFYSGTFFDRAILGLWSVAEGAVYPQFKKQKHVVPTEYPDLRQYEKHIISVDYGTVNPTSAGLWGLCEGVWHRRREYYFNSRERGIQRTDEEHYQALEELADTLRIDRVIVDPSAASFIECIHRHGRFATEAADNRVLYGIRETAEHLRAGDILFHDCCEDCIREFGLYRWDEKAKEDRPLKTDDHAMDEVRYFVCSAFRPSNFSF